MRQGFRFEGGSVKWFQEFPLPFESFFHSLSARVIPLFNSAFPILMSIISVFHLPLFRITQCSLNGPFACLRGLGVGGNGRT